MTGMSWHQQRAAGMHRLPGDIVGYDYNAERFCPRCIVAQLPTGPGEAFDGWALAPGVRMSTEDNLSEIAAAFGINRDDESAFDQSEFPKVVLRSMLSSCEDCGGLGADTEIESPQWGKAYADCAHCDGTGIRDRCGSCGEVLGE